VGGGENGSNGGVGNKKKKAVRKETNMIRTGRNRTDKTSTQWGLRKLRLQGGDVSGHAFGRERQGDLPKGGYGGIGAKKMEKTDLGHLVKKKKRARSRNTGGWTSDSPGGRWKSLSRCSF